MKNIVSSEYYEDYVKCNYNEEIYDCTDTEINIALRQGQFYVFDKMGVSLSCGLMMCNTCGVKESICEYAFARLNIDNSTEEDSSTIKDGYEINAFLSLKSYRLLKQQRR